MIIKLLEQPIIAIHEAETVGTVDGVIIEENKVSHIFHKNLECSFAIPVENVIIGPDAVMIKEVSALAMASRSIKPLCSMLDVYNLNGRYLGRLTAVEVDRNYCIKYIYTDVYKIEMSKTVNYESVLIADAEEEELQKNDCVEPLWPDYEAKIEKLKEEVEANLDCNVVIPLKPVAADSAPPTAENATEAAAENAKTEEEHLPSQSYGKTAQSNANTAGVDAKYAYLCGKKLLNSIKINGEVYEEGTIIDAALIRNAIENNAIVTLIVNAED